MSVFRTIKLAVVDAALWFFFVPFRMMAKAMPVRVVYSLATLAGNIITIVIGKKVQASCRELLKNCTNALDENQVEEVARRSIGVYVKRHFEDLLLSSLSDKFVESMVTIEGIEHLETALQRRKGVIIQLAHFGSFLMILPALAYKGYKVNQIVGKPELKHHRKVHKQIFDAKVKDNSSLPVRFVHVKNSIRPVINVLKRNELVAIAFDGRDGNDWVPVKFLGGEAYISPGSVRIAKVTGATILPTFIIRQQDDTHRLIIEPPLELGHRDGVEGSISENVQNLARVFEKYFIKYPCHFGMTFHVLKERADRGIIDMPFFKIN